MTKKTKQNDDGLTQSLKQLHIIQPPNHNSGRSNKHTSKTHWRLLKDSWSLLMHFETTQKLPKPSQGANFKDQAPKKTGSLTSHNASQQHYSLHPLQGKCPSLRTPWAQFLTQVFCLVPDAWFRLQDPEPKPILSRFCHGQQITSVVANRKQTPWHPNTKTSTSVFFFLDTSSVTSPMTSSWVFANQVLSPGRSQDKPMKRRRRDAEIAAIRWDSEREEKFIELCNSTSTYWTFPRGSVPGSTSSAWGVAAVRS